ncbi:MAG: FHA domain-containing protein [Acidimicrobiia bacterium]|nr:FHA domain-containing protein [Acidimicrobiia bacterium]
MAENTDKIVITADDLAGPDPTPPPPLATPPQGYAASSPLPALSQMQPTAAYTGGSPTGSSALAKFGANALIIGLIGGAIGGFLGTLLGELVYIFEPEWTFSNLPSGMELALWSGVWVMVVGSVIGFALTSLDGFTSGSPQKGLIDGLKGAGAGAAAGFIGGFVAQIIFSELLSDNMDVDKGELYLARILAWGIFGLLLGLGIGAPFGSKRMVYGLLGGLAGGAAGGLVFELVGQTFSSNGSGIVLRLIGLTITGLGIGGAIGLVERAFKDSWLAVVGGPMTGKEIILYKPVTLVGSDYRCDLVLVKDPGVALQHMSINREPSGAVSLYAAPGATVLVNGAPVQSHRLRPGDQIGIGSSTLTFQQRESTQSPSYPGAPSPY